MRQTSFTKIAIFALNVGSEEEERDILRTNGLNAHKPLVGVYQEQEERAWLVPITNPQHKADVLRLAHEHKQESVLFSGIDRTCQLYYMLTGIEEPIGVLQEVPEEYARTKSSYTFDPESGAYWVAS